MGLRQQVKAALWVLRAPLAALRYRGTPLWQAAGAFHGTTRIAGSGSFEIETGVVVGRRTVLRSEAGARLMLGGGARIGDDCELGSNGLLQIGASASLQNRSTVLGDVVIGAGCVCAANLFISSGWHHFADSPELPIRWQDAQAAGNAASPDSRSRPVQIGEDCWLGINVVVLPGVTIGRGCVVGANAVVSRDLPPYSVAVGAPARVVRQRLAFAPPAALRADLPAHLPYFYRGFDLWHCAPAGHAAALRDGALCAQGEFALALQAAPGRAVQLRLQTASGGTLRHGEQQQTIAPGVSVVRLLAQPQLDGLLQFSWSTGQGHAQATLGVLAAEQEQE